ncbi:MAG: hypothetical protein JWP42_2407 [Pseudomonas sp.]|nr:hypothetical protein [Pseudomonas sp.]
MSEALKEMVIAHDHIIAALIAALRKKDAIDLTLFTELIETMRKDLKEDATGKNETYNRIIETAKSACLILDQQPKAPR